MGAPVRLIPDWRVRAPRGDLHPGYLAGMAAGAGPAEVVLRRRVEATGGDALVLNGGDLVVENGDRGWLAVARARTVPAAALDVVPHALPSYAAAVAAAASEPAPSADCFVCGQSGERSAAVGLRLGPLGDGRVVAGVWSPGAELCPRSVASPALVWAVLSCAGLAAMRRTRAVEGHPAPQRMIGAVRAPIAASRLYTVAAWPEADGRVLRGTAVLMDGREEIVAVVRQVTPHHLRVPDAASTRAA